MASGPLAAERLEAQRLPPPFAAAPALTLALALAPVLGPAFAVGAHFVAFHCKRNHHLLTVRDVGAVRPTNFLCDAH